MRTATTNACTCGHAQADHLNTEGSCGWCGSWACAVFTPRDPSGD